MSEDAYFARAKIPQCLRSPTTSKSLSCKPVRRRNGRNRNWLRCTQSRESTFTSSQKINVKSTVVNDYESGRAIPNPQIISQLQRVLGVKLPKIVKPKKTGDDDE